MDEDLFNMELRKFLKKVGVTSQRAIEEAVRDGVENGTLEGRRAVRATVVLSLEGLDASHTVEGEIAFR